MSSAAAKGITYHQVCTKLVAQKCRSRSLQTNEEEETRFTTAISHSTFPRFLSYNSHQDIFFVRWRLVKN